MKLALLAVIFTVLVAVEAEKKCNNGDDCDPGECCIAGGILPIWRGNCKPLAKEGESCNRKEVDIYGQYAKHCPCESGLSCEPGSVKESVFGKIYLDEHCVSVPTSTEPDA